MNQNQIDYTSLRQSLAALAEALNVTQSQSPDTPFFRVARAGVIQNFEISYELCWKFLSRTLQQDLGRTAVEGLSRKELFRLASQHRLLNDARSWFEFHEARNLTTHTYDLDTAADVYARAQMFLDEASKLLVAFESK